MRITFLLETVYALFGSIQATLTLASGLASRGHDIDVVFVEQGLEPAQLGFAPCRVVPIEEPSDHVVRLAGPAMPGAESRAGKAREKIQ